MKDEFTTQFFSWLDRSDQTKRDIAEKLEIDHVTISGWRSRGVPRGKRLACKHLINEEQKENLEPNNVIVMKPSYEQFQTWNRTSLDQGLTIEDWAFKGLEKMAKQYFEDKPLRAVAEDGLDYETSAGVSKEFIAAPDPEEEEDEAGDQGA